MGDFRRKQEGASCPLKTGEWGHMDEALMTFHNVAPNSHVPVFLEFLLNALSATSHSKSICKAYL